MSWSATHIENVSIISLNPFPALRASHDVLGAKPFPLAYWTSYSILLEFRLFMHLCVEQTVLKMSVSGELNPSPRLL